MPAAPARDRLRDLIDEITGSLDEPLDGTAMAERKHFSRWHHDRILAASVGEPPVALRRRLLLERAAWQLKGGGATVTEVALDAGYGSLEAFSRAFRRGFGRTPSAFAAEGGDPHLPAPNGVHFHPPAGVLLPGPTDRSAGMDLTDRLLEHDLWLTTKLIDAAATLSDEDLDRVVRPGHAVTSWEGPEETVRQILERMVFVKEVWNAAIAGREIPKPDDNSSAGLRARFAQAGPEFVLLMRGVRDRGEWEAAFVDALCDPPETFTFGGVAAHVLTYAAARRIVLLDVLRELGVEDLDDGDPILWERGTRAA